jgi:hypothetical protein
LDRFISVWMVSKVLNLKWNRWNKTEISRSRSGQEIQNEIEIPRSGCGKKIYNNRRLYNLFHFVLYFELWWDICRNKMKFTIWNNDDSSREMEEWFKIIICNVDNWWNIKLVHMILFFIHIFMILILSLLDLYLQS